MKKHTSEDLFCDFYEDWVKVYKDGAVRPITLNKYKMIDRRSEQMTYESETEFETAVIQRLANAGWVNYSTGKPEILRFKTERELIANWASIIFENNNIRDRLNDATLTDGEMKQILDQIKALRTPVNLNRFINGGEVMIKRDNLDDPIHFGKEMSLKIFGKFL